MSTSGFLIMTVEDEEKKYFIRICSNSNPTEAFKMIPFGTKLQNSDFVIQVSRNQPILFCNNPKSSYEIWMNKIEEDGELRFLAKINFELLPGWKHPILLTIHKNFLLVELERIKTEWRYDENFENEPILVKYKEDLLEEFQVLVSIFKFEILDN